MPIDVDPNDVTLHAIGIMTGTSLDGLDACLVRIERPGLVDEMEPRFVRRVELPLGDDLRDRLTTLASGTPHPPLAYLQAARDLGERYADAVDALRGEERVWFVACHGQTIWHAPPDAGVASIGHSWQLFDPWPIAARCEVAVVYDLRQADLIAGGQGAPITPLADYVMYRRDMDGRRAEAVVNLGGIANVTFLPHHARFNAYDEISGRDVWPCNLLVDALMHHVTGKAYDEGGAFAASHPASPEAVHVIEDAVGTTLQHARRTLGREDFSPVWFDAFIHRLSALDVEPATWIDAACQAVAQALTKAIRKAGSRRVVLAGGGAKNRRLVKLMDDALGSDVSVVLSDAVGIPVEAREAMAMAVLGMLSSQGIGITLPQVTGAPRKPGVAGAWVNWFR